MLRNWMRLGTVPLLAVALWFAGCSDQAARGGELLGPETAAFAKGGNGKGAEKKAEKAPRVQGKKKNGLKAEFKLATRQLAKGDTTAGKAIIGPEGGSVTAAGHVLFVPKGAVAQRTLFKLKQYNKSLPDSSVVLAVDLKAQAAVDPAYEGDFSDLKDDQIWDVGANGFAVPVQLYLSYALSDNVDDSNVDGTTIVWLKTASYAEEVPHAVYKDKNAKWVHTLLDHFSDYALAWP